jgi:hypothetical protein
MSLTKFMGIPNSIRILYSTSFLTESQAILKYTNSWCTVPLYTRIFFRMWWMKKIWLAFELLRRNPHQWFPIISSLYGQNREWMLFDINLYEVYSSVIPP